MRRVLLVLSLLAVPAFAAERDLSVGWISRTPKIDYVWDSANPTRDGWPAVGSTVKWIANVRWLGDAPIDHVGYRWLLDGAVVESGEIDFAAESLVKLELPWNWTFERHEIVFEIDPDHRVVETEERNNQLLIHTNALALGLYVEKGYWEEIRAILERVPIGASTFEDWWQRRVRLFNEMAQYSVHPEAPDGVLDRWRIDEIHIVEDGSLPATSPYPEARDWGAFPSKRVLAGLYPNVRDYTVDMQWGFPTPTNMVSSTPWTLMIGEATMHELAHARSMIDTYAWNLQANDDFIRLDPAPPQRGFDGFYFTKQHGMMNLDWGHIDRYTAAAMNRMAGWRARRGNYNEPWDLGWFLNEIPERNRLRFLRSDGTPIARTTVQIYRASGESLPNWQDHPYAMVFDNTPDFELSTDSNGVVEVGRNLFSDQGIVAFVDRANGVAIAKITDGSSRRWAYLDSLEFNLAYWRGDTALATHDVVADAAICRDRLGPSAARPEAEALILTPEVTFEIPAEPERVIDLYYAIDGGPPQRLRVPNSEARTRYVTLTLPAGRVVWWFIDESTAPCPAAHSSIYAFDHQLDSAPRRRPTGH